VTIADYDAPQAANWPTADQVIAYMSAAARVVRIEDALLDAVGRGSSPAHQRNNSAVAGLRAGLADAYEDRDYTRAALFPGIRQ
jgi:hypothetical protein